MLHRDDQSSIESESKIDNSDQEESSRIRYATKKGRSKNQTQLAKTKTGRGRGYAPS